MMRSLLLTLVFSTTLAGAALAQVPPVPPDTEIVPEILPTVTPLPPKPPVSTPSPEPTSEPSAEPTVTPSAKPTAVPSTKPTPRPTAQATQIPQGKGQLSYAFAGLIEGQRAKLKLQLKGSLTYPVKGWVRYEDKTYDYAKTVQESVPFELKGPAEQEISLIFRAAGRKHVRIETEASTVRNAAVYVQPLAATVFPRTVNLESLSKDPSLWQVWVNLNHSLNAKAPQRQYYMVVYRGEILQKLLTSSAAPGKLTPEGSFKLGVKIASPKSTLYDSVMPFWTTILIPGHSYEYGNHGLTGEAYLYHLGIPASHGCLRLSNKWVQRDGQWLNIGGAKWVYSNVPVGTPIRIFRRAVQPFAFENYSMWLTKKR